MLVGRRHPEPANCVPLEIEFHQDRGLISNHPPIVARLNRHNLWCGELPGTTVRELNMDPAARQETDVCVHAEIRSDQGLYIRGPAESRRIDQALDASVAGADDIDLDVPELAVFGFLHGCKEWIGATHNILLPSLRSFAAQVAFYQCGVLR